MAQLEWRSNHTEESLRHKRARTRWRCKDLSGGKKTGGKGVIELWQSLRARVLSAFQAYLLQGGGTGRVILLGAHVQS